MPRRSEAVRAALAAALIAMTACGPAPRPAATAAPAAHARVARVAIVARAPAAPALAADDRFALLCAAYRFELALHASDADRAEFGAFFLDYPADQEGDYLAAFAWQSPPVRQRRYCRITPEKAVVDTMTGAPALSFVAEITTLEPARALVTMTWYSDPESGAASVLGMERGSDGWRVTGIQVLWAH
jgi:hypothetical protein